MSVASPPGAARAGPNPFVGPRPFERGERLYGREREISELHYRLNAERILLLHSPSGAGKSSLVQAGLVPLLDRSFDVWGPTRVNAEPAVPGANRYVLSAMQGFEEGVPERLRRSPDVLAAQTLAGYFEKRPRRRSAPQNVVLLFDQFEEILTVDPLAVEARREFFDQLGELLRNPRVWALFALREEHLARLDPYAPQVPTHFKNRFRIDLLGLEAAREAMIEPAREGGRAFPAVDRLAADLAIMKVQQPDGSFVEETGQHVEPVQLQVVCRRLWDAMPEDDLSIDASDLERFGDVTEALAGYYAESVARTAAGDPARERAIRDWFGEKLITVGGIRGQVLREAEASGGLPNELIDPLCDTHLVRAEKRAGATWYELAHDRLIEPVQEDNAAWREVHLAETQRRAALWEQQGRPPGLLLTGPEVAAGERWAAENQGLVTPVERRFLDESGRASLLAERERRQARRIRWLALGATLTSIIALVALSWALSSYVGVKREARRGASRELALQSSQLLDRQLDLALLLSLEAIRIAPTLEARRSLLAALQHNPRLWRFLPPGGPGKRLRVAFRPGGSMLATAGESDAIELWEPETGKQLRGSPLRLDNAFEVRSVAFSPDGRWLAAGGKTPDNAGLLGLWDLSVTPPRRQAAPQPKTVVRGVAFCRAADGVRLAWISKDELSLWRPGSSEVPQSLQKGRRVASLAATPDCSRLAVGHEAGGGIDLWDSPGTPGAITSQLLWEDGGTVEFLAFDPAGEALAAINAMGKIAFWGQGASQPDVLHTGMETRSLAFADGKTLIVTGYGRAIDFLDLETRAWSPTLDGYDARVVGIAFDPNGPLLATAGEDGKVILWKNVARRARRLLAHRDEVWGVAFSPDGRRLVSGEGKSVLGRFLERSGEEGTVRLWDLGSGTVTVLPASSEPTRAVAFSPDGQWIASGSRERDSTLHLWRLSGKDGRPVEALRSEASNPINAIAFHPDGRSLFVAEGRDLVQWSFDQELRVDRKLATHPGTIWSLLFRDNGKTLLASDETGQIFGWDVATGQQKSVLEPDPPEPQILAALAESPDGRLVAAASREGPERCVFLWEMPSGKFKSCLMGHEQFVTSIAFGADGTLFSADQGGDLIVWDPETRQKIGQMHHGSTDLPVNSLAVSPDGRTLASASDDRTLLLWNLDWQSAAREVAGRDQLTEAECRTWIHFEPKPESCKPRR